MEVVWGIMLGEGVEKVKKEVAIGVKRQKDILMPIIYEQENDVEKFRKDMHKRIDSLIDAYKITRGIE